jgi:fluoroacetyl-CoA thioesterase
MKDSLKPGLIFEFLYQVPKNRTVPHLLPESAEFGQMPEVLASGFMVGLIEWACIQAINPHLDWPHEQTVGIDFHLNHTAATPPGLTVRVQVRLEEVAGRKLTFSILADDGVDKISQGTHDRFIIDAARFKAKVADKLSQS